jgi:hypothetical protein
MKSVALRANFVSTPNLDRFAEMCKADFNIGLFNYGYNDPDIM